MFDLAALVALALPALVLGVLCVVAVKLTSAGPVFFRQDRIGHQARRFELVKFRTMVDMPDNPLFPDDERITRVGRLLRRLSLDELPQLINVARGEMSLVGPRPTLAYQVERYTEHQRQRLSVRPGLTGLAQVEGRNRLAWADRIELDLQYVARQSPLLDFELIARTAVAVLRGAGVGGHPQDDPIANPAPIEGEGGSTSPLRRG
jgi:lipopolysaccharide/colanic/teichoic acid biosynthesis glycosyltransferase